MAAAAPGAAVYHRRRIEISSSRTTGCPQLLLEMKPAGADRVVCVPPSWEGYRNDYALEAARKFPRRFAIMGKITLNDPSGRERIATWTQQSGMLGFSFSFRHGSNKGLSKWMRTQLLESAYRSYAQRIFFPPYLEFSGVQVVVDDLATSRADSKGRKAQEFVKEEVLRELDKQCFFKALQKK